jgi:dTDP-4-amino-4,6-dideoxygalactose transaminase
LKLEKIKRTHQEIFESMRDQGIGVNLHYIPVHTQPYYLKMGFKLGDFPESEQYYAEAMSLPMYAGLTDREQDQVVEALKKSLVS